MLWIIQENLWNEGSDLAEICRKEKLPHLTAKIVPFGDELIPEPSDSEKAIIAFGSTSMMRIAKKRGWVPGVYHDDKTFDFRTWMRELPSKHLLNGDGKIDRLAEFCRPWSQLPSYFFIRPCSDLKPFAGQMMSLDKFKDWVKKLFLLDSTVDLSMYTHVLISSTKEIYEEVRFFVVNGEIITGSVYKRHGHIVKKERVDHHMECWKVAEQLISIWEPHKAYCMDLARIFGGWKLIEYNTINACGFYACDMKKVVRAIRDMET